MADTVIARLTGRCANGAERDGGKRSHVINVGAGRYAIALCGARPGRLSNGWDACDDQTARPTCPRCARKVDAS